MQPDNFDEILQAKAKLRKYLKEKCYSELHQQSSFKYFVKSFFIPKSLSKASEIQTTISRVTLYPYTYWWLILPIQNDAINLKNDRNPGTWSLI